MSTLYNLEPPPTAKVLLSTTLGDLELELFAKQTPLASRNFLQHCLDGYYNNTIFHRLLKDFIIQGGDPTGTGHGGESALPGEGTTFEDEFHSRLKYNRRGLLGMANGGSKNDNGSQFFLTLAATPELQARNTIFGRVAGDTIYNLMKMGDAELEPVEGSERPVYPTKITGAEILVNPFEDMVKRVLQPKAAITSGQTKDKKKAKKKGGKALLSFGNEDAEGEDGGSVTIKQKFKPKLVQTAEPAIEKSSGRQVGGEGKQSSQMVSRKINQTATERISRSPTQEIKKPAPALQLPLKKDEEPSRSPLTSPEPPAVQRVTSLLDKTNAQIADLKASMKRNTGNTPADVAPKKTALEQMMPKTAIRGGRKRKHGARENMETDTLSMLSAFRTRLEHITPDDKGKISSVREDHGGMAAGDNTNQDSEMPEDEEGEVCDLHFIANCQSCKSWDKQQDGQADSEDEGNDRWMSHALNFEKDRLGKDLTWKKKMEEDLIVIDPREKAQNIKEEERAKKMARLGGKAATEWSRARDKEKISVR